MDKVDTSGECWVWKNSLGRNGYGTFVVASKSHAAHRWVLAYTLGRELAASEVARHKCHNKACVRPSHLEPGTQSDNMQDMAKAGRGRRGPHADCGHENTKRDRYLCRKANGTKQAYTRGVSDYDRFMSYVDTSAGPDACWPWMRYIDRTGYGEFDVTENGRQRKFKATRWIAGHLRGEELTRGEVVLHACDRPECVAPHHLRVGTHTENMLDMMTKGRGRNGRSGQTHCKHGHEYTPENTYTQPGTGWRQCLACRAARAETARPTPAL
ncbi:HNH endonuclease [Streptomyces sp. NPDC020766]|uniref:HNH endonuclease n=1 Tax=Streptomyces sp. NPDC020766 TaxID=3155011 RepID=UPI0033E2D620